MDAKPEKEMSVGVSRGWDKEVSFEENLGEGEDLELCKRFQSMGLRWTKT